MHPWVERHLSGTSLVGLAASDALEKVRALLSSADKPPRGFEKFYRDKEKTASSEDDAGGKKGKDFPGVDKKKEESSKSKSDLDELTRKLDQADKLRKEFFFSSERPKGGGSAGGGGKKGGGFGDSDRQRVFTAIGMGAFAVALIAGLNQLNYREISWKDFVNNYLARGVVEKLVVVNGKWVKVSNSK